MEVIYYYDSSLGYCPVKNYLNATTNCYNIKNRKLRLLSDIKAKIDTIARNNGKPTGKFSSKLKACGSFEIKQRKNEKVVIRILYFLHRDKMILLHAFEKPDDYHTKKEKSKIDKQYKIAEEYIKKYKLNTKLYEKYE